MFTKEEVSLCKQVAEKHRKKIEYGDWFYSKHLREVLLQSPFINIVRDLEIVNMDENSIPLWTISDCLGWLKKLKSFRAYFIDTYSAESRMLCVNFWDEQDKIFIRKGKTPLEACLKAVLAVLEEAK